MAYEERQRGVRMTQEMVALINSEALKDKRRFSDMVRMLIQEALDARMAGAEQEQLRADKEFRTRGHRMRSALAEVSKRKKK